MQYPDVLTFNQLLLDLYRGAFETTPWKAFLTGLKKAINADLTVLGLRKPNPINPGVVFVSEVVLNQDFGTLYRTQLAAIDPFVNLPDGRAVTLHEMIPSEKLKTLPYYRDFMIAKDYVYHMGLDLYAEKNLSVFMRVVRGQSGSDFGEAEKTLLNLLAPHLRNLAVWLEQQEEQSFERLIYGDVVNQLALGCIALDEEGNILSKNPTAQHILDQEDGLLEKNNRLMGQTDSVTRSLRQLSTPSGDPQKPSLLKSILVPRTYHEQPLYLTIRPGVEGAFGKSAIRPRQILFIHAPEMNASCSNVSLQKALGLTTTETRFVIELANGFTVEEIAEKFNVTRNTTRTHLQRVFQKTGVNKQAALVKFVMRCIASLN